MDSLKEGAWRKGHLFFGHHGPHQVEVLITGVGMVATAFHCGKMLHENYDLAINAGVCGSFNKNLEPGAVVHIYEDRLAELGAEDDENFLSLEALELPGISHVVNSRSAFDNSVVQHLPRVTAITVNTTHGNEKSIEKVVQRFHPYVESMEGAAFMIACELEQIPYIQLRAVSNYVEKRNRESWNIPLAIRQLNETLIQILHEYKH
jgi:futalosine hydrolase